MADNKTIIHSTLDEGYDFFITDNWNKKYHFKISTFAVPMGFLSEAIEVIDDETENEPRIFHVLSNFDSDIEIEELLLKEKIKKGINRKYLNYKDGKYSIGDELEIAGRILWDDNLNDSGFDYCFQIDGKKLQLRTLSIC